jgi:hypothetical protein
MIDYPNPAYLRMTVRGGIPADLSDGVGKVATSSECKSIRIAESSVMDGWDDRCLAQCRFCFSKVDFRKMEKGAGRSTRKVLPWHEYDSEYLQGTAEGMEVVMCD